MGHKFKNWQARSSSAPTDFAELARVVQSNRGFRSIDRLNYGDHGLEEALETVRRAIKNNTRIALYADYDVDGTMSCVSWIWFFKAIGFDNYTHYIPDRFQEGYGVNLKAVQYLVETQKAGLIITMDTGITANAEAAWCLSRGVDFVCTDHHVIQKNLMPDCVILNPKTHPDPEYQELCGCGITFVLLRQLGQDFSVPPQVWQDLLALTGMATICDVVPLNSVNHKLARQGVQALVRSKKKVLVKLLEAAAIQGKMDEKDVGFRLGPRINAVGRLEHANKVVEAFLDENPEELIQFMGICNDRRKAIQKSIVEEATAQAKAFPDAPILFLGGDWHQGVVGIAASKLAEMFWRPVWLFHKGDDLCKGSARSIPDFDVTEAMVDAGELFHKFGGHKAAAGYAFMPEQEEAIRESLTQAAEAYRSAQPDIWVSRKDYDCELPLELAHLSLADALDDMKPFGHGFEEPCFKITGEMARVVFYKDKGTGEPKHTCVHIRNPAFGEQKILFFNEVFSDLQNHKRASFLVTAGRNHFQGRESLSLFGVDFAVDESSIT